jgi:RNA polymerase sigma-70 factor, ECF subfamily
MAAVSPVGRASGVERRDAPGDALTGLYERHASRVFHYCLNWLRSREEAEDAAQTTFLYAYRGLDRGVVPAHERPWLLSIARNVCLSRSDAARRRGVEVAQDPHSLEESIGAPAPSSELDGLTEALAMLTEQQRHAILLREWHGLTYSEIAERLELSQAAVETLLFRARRSLARRLREPVGIGSFLPWLRSLGEGGAVKVALGAAAVAVTATTGAVAIAHQHQLGYAVPTHTVRSAPTPRAVPDARAAHVAPKAAASKHHAAVAKATSAPVVPQAQQPAATMPQPRAENPAASAPTTAQPVAAQPVAVQPVAAAQPITNSVTAATTDAAAPVVDTVTNTVSSVVDNTTGTVANTAATVVTTAQAAVAAVMSLVPAIAPRLVLP